MKKNKVFGDCFQNSVRYMFDNELNEDLILVQGIVTGSGEHNNGMRMVHAWIEEGDVVIDAGHDMDNPFIVRKEVYYRGGQIKEAEIKRYTYEEMCGMLYKTKIYGPWEIKANEEEERMTKKLLKKHGGRS